MNCPVCRTELQHGSIGSYCPNYECEISDDWRVFLCDECGGRMFKTEYGFICGHCNNKKV